MKAHIVACAIGEPANAVGVGVVDPGSVALSRSLSGYVTTADRHMLIFSFLSNNWTVPTRIAAPARKAKMPWYPYATMASEFCRGCCLACSICSPRSAAMVWERRRDWESGIALSRCTAALSKP